MPKVTGAVGWRQDSIRYKKNEVFLDAIETVNMLMSAQGRWAGGNLFDKMRLIGLCLLYRTEHGHVS